MINLFLSVQPLLRLAEEGGEVSFSGDFLVPFIISLVLVAINGLFVAAEFAMLGSRPSKMEQLRDEGNVAAGSILKVLESPTRQNSYLATAQLGITIVTLVLAMYGEPHIAHYLEATFLEVWFPDWGPDAIFWTGYAIVIFLLTALHIVFGEMIPKAIALGDPSSTVISLNRPMMIIEQVFKLPILVLNGIGNILLRIFRIPPEHGSARLYSSDEIEALVSESTEGGLIASESEEMISNIFDFHDRAVGQVMTPRRKVEGIPHDIPYDQLLVQVTNSRHSRFPVYKEDLDHVVGILHLKDLVRHYRHGTGKFELETILRPTPVVPETHSVTELLRALKLQRIHIAVVLDEYGGVAGIVTLEDLVEEIVGEVRDEFDVENEPFVEVEPGILETSGDYLLDMLREDVFLGEDAIIPDVDTVGGFVVTHLGRPPELGDVVSLENGVVITVIGIDGRAVSRVQIDFPTPEVEDHSAETDPSH
ncbi:MAG: hemolysin family protein [Candidatus Promineifilaceae bacterium]